MELLGDRFTVDSFDYQTELQVKKSSKAQSIAKRKCDVLFSQIIRSIGKCEFTGSTQSLQCAHIISRKFGQTRTDFRNALCLSASEHRKGHDNPLDFAIKATKWAQENNVNLSEVRESAYAYGKMDWVARLEELKDIGRLVESGKLTLKELRVKSKWETFELSASDLL